MRNVLPEETSVESKSGILYVWRASALRPLLDVADARAQLPQIAALGEAGDNGILLGYGANSLRQRPAVRVRIEDAAGHPVVGFHTTPEDATRVIAQRLWDLRHATGRNDFVVNTDFLP
ncbi:MAG: hypothetical protein ACOYMN_15160 [Roseimicrobium sp.]